MFTEHEQKAKLCVCVSSSEGTEETVVIPAEHSKLYLWEDPLLQWQLQWQVSGEPKDVWTTVEVSQPRCWWSCDRSAGSHVTASV